MNTLTIKCEERIDDDGCATVALPVPPIVAPSLDLGLRYVYDNASK